MDSHTLEVLEFDKIRQILRGHAASEPGSRLCAGITPSHDRESVEAAQQETTEARRVYDEGQDFPLDGIWDVRPILARLRMEGALADPQELLKIGSTLGAARRMKRFLSSLSPELRILKSRGNALAEVPQVENSIERSIDPHGEVKDSASHELAGIRRSLRRERSQIVSYLESLVKGGNLSDYVQGDYVTFREGRYVIPIQAKFKSRVKGIVHGQSDSGTTCFIEPLEAIPQGNRLRELESEERIEIRRILLRLSNEVRAHALEMEGNADVLARLDFAWAKARFSARFHMNRPAISPDSALELCRARHPLLMLNAKGDPRQAVVPLDLKVDSGLRTIVITGPNTGGKTVCLKTIGLMVLMHQCGLHIPADPESRLPVYHGLYADIGDEQSIEQNLSTFSSHLSNIIAILENAGHGSLVLLDELGAGTDPLEGGALGQAILKALLEKGALTVATTHLNDLKVFAHLTDGVENAAMEFDTATLSPTFRLSVGAPGASNALAIARRLRIPERVLENAREAIRQDKDDAVGQLRKLAEDAARAREHREHWERERRREADLNRELERKIHAVEKDRKDEVRRAREEARGIIRDLEAQSERWLREMRTAERNWRLLMEEARASGEPSADSPVTRAAGRLPEQVREAARRMEHTARQELTPEPVLPVTPINPELLEAGLRVKVAGFSAPGKVVEVDRERGSVLLLIHNAEVRLPANRVEGVVEKSPAREPVFATDTLSRAPGAVPYEIDIHGLRVEEAEPIVDKYLDDAYLSGAETVTIVHGVGTGALRRLVQELCRQNRIVRDSRPGTLQEGGIGVTIVRLAR